MGEKTTPGGNAEHMGLTDTDILYVCVLCAAIRPFAVVVELFSPVGPRRAPLNCGHANIAAIHTVGALLPERRTPDTTRCTTAPGERSWGTRARLLTRPARAVLRWRSALTCPLIAFALTKRADRSTAVSTPRMRTDRFVGPTMHGKDPCALRRHVQQSSPQLPASRRFAKPMRPGIAQTARSARLLPSSNTQHPKCLHSRPDVHVVPRRHGDGLHLPWTGQQKAGDHA